MSKNRIIVILSAVILLGLFLFLIAWPSPKTPKGIDMSPINDCKIDGQINIVDHIEKKITDKQPKKDIKSRGDTLLFSSPNDKHPNDVFRTIEIWQFRTTEAALDKYNSYKKTFTDRSMHKSLYKEEREGDDKYFMSYESVHFDYNHGIPCGIVSKPSILIGVLKNNVLIVIAYDGYRYYDDYIKEINEDIVYVSQLLKTNWRHSLNNSIQATGKISASFPNRLPLGRHISL